MYNEMNDQSKLINIFENDNCYFIYDYLSYNDSKNVSLINDYTKSTFNKYFQYKAPFIIQSFMKKIIIFKNKIEYKMMNYDEKSITVKDMALIYFFFYDNKYIYLWLNRSCKEKNDIITKKYHFNFKNKKNISKFDLFNCQILMSKNDIEYLGW